MKAATGSRDRTGSLGPDNWDRTAETSWTGQVSLIGNLDSRKRGQESQDMTMFGKSKQIKSNLKNYQADIRNMDISLYVPVLLTSTIKKQNNSIFNREYTCQRGRPG